MKVDQGKVNKYIAKLKPYSCPLCHKGEWIVGDMIFHLTEYFEDELRIGGTPSFPVLPLVCSECGNTIFINALAAGLLDNDKEAK